MTGSEVSISLLQLTISHPWPGTGKLPEAGFGTEKGLTRLTDSDFHVSLILGLRLTLQSQTLHGVEQATPI